MKRVRIDYTIYSPDYAYREKGEWWDLPTFCGAKKKARELGIGSIVIRNFNQDITGDWWQSTFCWLWNGFTFTKTLSLDEKKWVIDRSGLCQTAVLRRYHLHNQ